MTHIEPLNRDKMPASDFLSLNITIDKLNEVIGDYEHLKEVVLCRQLEKDKSDTASNQSNTELPQKIKLLKEFAGYPAGEYILGGEGGGYGRTYRSVSNERGCSRGIHIDIIKATSGQGIRSEVTDGEESVSRTKEYTTCYEKDCPGCKHCEPSTPQTEPIESAVDDRVEKAYEYYEDNNSDCVTLPDDVEWRDYDLSIFREAIKKFSPKEKQIIGENPEWKTYGQLCSSPPLESKYEGCAKEIQEVLNRRELRGNFPVLDRVMEAVKKYF